jgi:hypothetical protein
MGFGSGSSYSGTSGWRLRDFYLRLARRKSEKVVIVACARRLLVWIYRMLIRGVPYCDEKRDLTGIQVAAYAEDC